ncbi:hypothetical protein A0256_19605 [Mucilaginibacter sp. PAMC 26640]|nr:hypothetical protein A0256_19605 [Mucilaginibacter sp. PAMC 26640]
MSFLKIAVISDLHCKHKSAEHKNLTSTILYSNDIGVAEFKHPVKALYKFIKAQELKADIVLCPGDVTDSSDDQGLLTGFSYLEKISKALDTEKLIFTIGNHDVNSRDSLADDVFNKLKNIDEKYPLPTKTANDHYWLHGFAVITDGDVLILVFNSCYSHRTSAKAQKSKIDQPTLDKINAELALHKVADFKHKILLCHHHPLNHANIDYEDSDVIDKGDLLIDLVVKNGFHICVHGHKHEPRLRTVSKLPIFCSGSFSSLMNVSVIKGDNTFHMIYLKETENKGYIKTWVHLPMVGWMTRDDSQFPSYVGFGYQGNIEILAKQIVDFLEKTGSSFIQFETLEKQFEDILYLDEQDQKKLSTILLDKYHWSFEPNYPNKPRLLLKQVI